MRIHNNTFYWNPPIDAPAVQMDQADFTGSRANVFQSNLIHSAVPRMIRSSGDLRFDHNLYWYVGSREPEWSYGGREHVGFSAYRRDSRQDAAGLFADPKLTTTMRLRSDSPAIDAGGSVGGSEAGDAFGAPVPRGKAPDIGALEHEPGGGDEPAAGSDLYLGSWALVSHLVEDDASRAQLVFLQSALEQFGERGLERGLVVAVGFHGGVSGQLEHDWNLGAIRTFAPGPIGADKLPTTLLVAPDGAVVRRWEGFTPPADLGLTLRALIGPPSGSPAVELPRDAWRAPTAAAPGR